MTDEVNQNTGIEVPGESKPLSRIQEEAISQGWVPREEFHGEDDEFIDAPEFVRRGELFRKIESQSKEMKELRKAFNGLASHNAKIREVEYKRALDDLKAQKKEALSEGDADKVVDIDDKIDLVKEQQRVDQIQQVQQSAPEIHPELRAWIDKNPWYTSDARMKNYADTVGTELGGTMSASDVLKEVEKEVRARFPEKFRNPNRAKAAAVEGVQGRPTSRSEADVELSDVEKTVMNTLIKGGHITKEEYMKQLKAIKAKA